MYIAGAPAPVHRRSTDSMLHRLCQIRQPWLPAASSSAASGWATQPGENDRDDALSQIPLSHSSIKAYGARKSKTQRKPIFFLAARGKHRHRRIGWLIGSEPSNWSTARPQTLIR
ncbi:hypothetical protein ACLOJK_036753 [Asimina triloba]